MRLSRLGSRPWRVHVVLELMRWIRFQLMKKGTWDLRVVKWAVAGWGSSGIHGKLRPVVEREFR